MNGPRCKCGNHGCLELFTSRIALLREVREFADGNQETALTSEARLADAAVALGGTPLTGGYGSVVKTIVGALTLTVVRNGLTIAGVPPSWSQVALGALLIAAIAISLNRSKVDVVK